MSAKLPIVAIVGRANVGKSSIFNRLVNQRQAIVSDVAGTTRDAIYGKVHLSDRSFWIVDTAGMKNAEDDFELTIQEQIIQATEAADAIVVVAEYDIPLTDEDRRVAKLALKSKKPCILLVNKADRIREDTDLSAYMRLGIKTIFATSAVHNSGFDDLVGYLANQLPRRQEEDTDMLRLSFIGRPNVGKSSLFNALLAKQMAVVANVAGTTRDVNRHEITWHQKTVQLLDTAGIRRSGKIGLGIEHFSVLRALAAIEESDVCCLVLDGNELNTKLDQKIAGMIREAGKGLIVVVSKWDSVEKDPFTRDALAADITREFPFISWAPLIFTSAVTGQNVTKLYEIAFGIKERRAQKIATKELNNWLHSVTHRHPPAAHGNNHPKLSYMVQDAINPPSFRIYGKHAALIHWSYKRYLERELRERYDFNGTAVQFYFYDKKPPIDKESATPEKE